MILNAYLICLRFTRGSTIKRTVSGWEISFRKSSVRGSKESSVRGSPRWKDTFSIDDKGGEIYQMQR
jgi:hypothetical protein